MEARAGIEPACKDLQSSASPLRHRATGGEGGRIVPDRVESQDATATSRLSCHLRLVNDAAILTQMLYCHDNTAVP